MNPGGAKPSDEELAGRASAGSRAAFEELVSRFTPRLFYFLRTKAESDEDIEDLIQETFLRAYHNIARYDARWKFSTWLYTLAVRLAVSRRRSKMGKPLQLDDLEGPECPFPGPQEILMRKEETRRQKNIWILARTLKPVEYKALWLRYAEDMPVKDIASAMKKSQISVRVLLHRARLKLGNKLQPSAQPAGAGKTVEAEQRFSVL